MSFDQFAFWMLCGLLATLVTLMGWFFTRILDTLKNMDGNIAGLNNKVAVVIEKQSWHEKEIERLDKRIDSLVG